MKKGDNCIYYQAFNWEKPHYQTFFDRIKSWYTKEEAISMNFKSTKKTKTKVSKEWRVCTKCKKRLLWKHFHKRKNWLIGYRSDCKDCFNKHSKEYKNREWIREKINANEKLRREWKGKEYYNLDILYYNDSIIKRNRAILRKKEDKIDIRINKFYYFFNKWYDKEYLLKLYNLTRIDVRINYREE